MSTTNAYTQASESILHCKDADFWKKSLLPELGGDPIQEELRKASCIRSEEIFKDGTCQRTNKAQQTGYHKSNPMNYLNFKIKTFDNRL